MEHFENELVKKVNTLLRLVGISAEGETVGVMEFRRVASSIFVALFEKIFSTRLEGIIRNPSTKSDYVVNSQNVIDSLSNQIQIDLQHISGLSIVNGDLRALSNLVHIFFRIIHITSGGSLSSSDFEYSDGNLPPMININFSGESIDESISTHESDFQGQPNRLDDNMNVREKTQRSRRKQATGGLRKMAENLRRNLEIPSGEFKHIIEREAESLLRSSEIMLAQEQRLEAARKRRESINKQRENQFGTINSRKESTRNKVQYQRFLDESKREEDAFNLRRSNEEHVMLRKIYKGFLKKMHEWRADKHLENRSRNQAMRDEARRHIGSLQTLFEDRVRILRDQEATNTNANTNALKAHRKMSADMRKALSYKQTTNIKAKKSLVNQKREHELLMRREAHKNLLALLSTEAWSDSLRFDNERKGKSATKFG